MRAPAEALQAQGFDVTIVEPGANTGIGGFVRGGQLTSLMLPEGADVIVLQRPSNSLLADAVPLARAQGVAVVVDMDDDLARIHPRNAAFHTMHPKQNPTNNWAHIERACRAATLVTCSTPALLPRYAPHGRGRVLFNYVPRRFLDTPHVDNETFGWAGTLHSHPDDLDQTAGAAARLVREGHPFRIVGPRDGIAAKLGIRDADIDATGVLPLADWIPAVSTLGVAMAPLADTSFNQAKSWLRGLEASAAGVPWIASDLPEHRRLAKLCDAPLVTKPKGWYGALKRFLTEPSLRAEQSERVRAMAATLTIEEHAGQWADAWADALVLERQTVPR